MDVWFFVGFLWVWVYCVFVGCVLFLCWEARVGVYGERLACGCVGWVLVFFLVGGCLFCLLDVCCALDFVEDLFGFVVFWGVQCIGAPRSSGSDALCVKWRLDGVIPGFWVGGAGL